MDKNLRTTKYNDGTAIESGTHVAWYNGVENYKYIYGALYSGYAVTDARGLCPDGWKVPTLDDLNVLVEYLGGTELAGGKMKSLGTIQEGTGIWEAPNTNATNESGFKGVPGGSVAGIMGQAGYWWLNTLATISTENDALHYLELLYNSEQANTNIYSIDDLNSVRCLRENPATVPQLETVQVTNITATTAATGGTLTMADDITDKGVVWGLTAEPTLESNLGKLSVGVGDEDFTCSVTGLSPETTYYVRAYAVNSLGVGYGQVEQFTTIPPSVPELTTKPVVLLSATSASTGGNIITDGGSAITTKGVVWSTVQNPSVDNYDGITYNGTGVDDFESQMTGLSLGSVYYVRAFASNGVGTGYGNEVEFSTAYSITFILIDENNQPLEGASITLEQEAISTGADGMAKFYRVDGTYPFSIVTTGYFPISGEVVVSGQDVEVKYKLTSEGSTTSQILGDRSACVGSELLYKASGASNGTWAVTGGEIVENNETQALVRWISSDGNEVISYSSIDTDGYQVVIQVPVTISQVNTVSAADKPDIYRKGHLNILICTNQSSSYKWYRNGDQMAGQNKQYVVARQQDGQYRVQVIKSQCPHTSDAFDLSAKSAANGALSVYPNPSNGTFTLSAAFGTNEQSEVTISNAFGVIVYKDFAPAQDGAFKHQINLRGLTPGVYIVTLLIDGDLPLTTKLTIQ